MHIERSLKCRSSEHLIDFVQPRALGDEVYLVVANFNREMCSKLLVDAIYNIGVNVVIAANAVQDAFSYTMHDGFKDRPCYRHTHKENGFVLNDARQTFANRHFAHARLYVRAA